MNEDAQSQRYPVVIVGAGQAGLSAGYYLQRKGLRAGVDFTVLDANEGPGGAWRDRWDSLTVGGAHRIHPLPGSTLPETDGKEPASSFVTRYYAAYEDERGLSVQRPAKVTSVRQDPTGAFAIDFVGAGSRPSSLAAQSVINATGTWNRPFIPHYPGASTFAGHQLHTRGFKSASEFSGQTVLVVGGGTSAVQFVQELSRGGAQPIWTTRSTPRWTLDQFDDHWGARVEDQVARRTTRGLRPVPVVATTGIPLEDRYTPDVLSGLLISRGPVLRFAEASVVLDGPGPDGTGFPSQGAADRMIAAAAVRAPRLPGASAENSTSWETPIDAVLWATGFRHDLNHLAPLRLREHGGGIAMAPDEVSVPASPGLFLTGYGAAASTRGAVWAGRRAAAKAMQYLRGGAGPQHSGQ